jgi:hypothetical protein
MMTINVVKNVLKSFKGLSDTQAAALIEIIKQQKAMTKKEIDVLLNKSHICEGNSSYKIIGQLVDKKVLFESNGEYEPINTSMLISECSQSLGKLEAEIEGLEIAKNWEESDPRKKSQQIDDEWKIINELHKLKKDDFEITTFYQNDDSKMTFWNDVKAHLKIKPTKGLYNCIIFCNKNKQFQNSGVILLSKRLTKEGLKVFYGNLIFDEDLFKIFNKKGCEK